MGIAFFDLDRTLIARNSATAWLFAELARRRVAWRCELSRLFRRFREVEVGGPHARDAAADETLQRAQRAVVLGRDEADRIADCLRAAGAPEFVIGSQTSATGS